MKKLSPRIVLAEAKSSPKCNAFNSAPFSASFHSWIPPQSASRAFELPKASCISSLAVLPNLTSGLEYWPPVTVLVGPSCVPLAIFKVFNSQSAVSFSNAATISSAVAVLVIIGSLPLANAL